MPLEKEDLVSKRICKTTFKTNEGNQSNEAKNTVYLEQKMAPAANDRPCDSAITLDYLSNSDSVLASINAIDLKDQISIAQAMIRKKKDNTAEEEMAAIVAARQIEARKEQELELARLVRRHHEDEQLQKQWLSIRERGVMKPDPGLFTLAGSAVQDSTTRLRSLQEELALLRSSSARGNEDDGSLKMQGRPRLLPLAGYGSGLLSISSSSLLSRKSSFLENQASVVEGLHERGNSTFNRTSFDNNRSQAILNALYSSSSSPITSNRDIPTLHKYYSGIAGSTILDKIRVGASIPGINLLRDANARADWLRASTGGTSPNSTLISIPSLKHGKHALEGHGDLFVASKRLKMTEGTTDGSDQEGEQQQKRFNKHQCKQWTLKFHELLAFKEKMGHCNVPHGYKGNLALAMWVKRQRHQYNLMVEKKTSTLTGERIKLLENIGFVWNCLETAWEQHFQDLRDFVLRTGHCAVPSTYKRNPRLASWVVTQRRQCKLLEDGKQSSMTQKRLEKLRQIGFPIKTKKTGLAKNSINK